MTSYDSAADPAGAARLWASIDAQARPAYLTGGYTAQLERVDSAALQEPIAPIPYMRRSGKMDLLRPKAAPSPAPAGKAATLCSRCCAAPRATAAKGAWR